MEKTVGKKVILETPLDKIFIQMKTVFVQDAESRVPTDRMNSHLLH